MYMFHHHMQHWMRHRKLIIIALFQQHLFKTLQLNQRQWICSHAQQITKHSLNQWRSQRSSPDSNSFSRFHIQTIMNKRVRPTLNTNILHSFVLFYQISYNPIILFIRTYEEHLLSTTDTKRYDIVSINIDIFGYLRSEERRVGKECRYW